MLIGVQRIVVSAACLAAVLAGCGADGSTSDTAELHVVAGFYPLQFLAEEIAGEHALVESLTKPGAEPHDLELTPRQVADLQEADAVFLIRGLAPAVDDAATGDNVLDLGTVTPLDEGFEPIEEGVASGEHIDDPHVWLDPVRVQALASAVRDRLSTVDSTNAADYQAGAKTLETRLSTLHEEFRTGLRSCTRHEIVTSHNAFGYLAQRYGLTQVGILGLTPDAEPSGKRLADVAAFAREHGATTIFFESLVSPKIAETLANEVGARTAVLDPLEGPPDDGDYFSAMRANLRALQEALDCA